MLPRIDISYLLTHHVCFNAQQVSCKKITVKLVKYVIALALLVTIYRINHALAAFTLDFISLKIIHA